MGLPSAEQVRRPCASGLVNVDLTGRSVGNRVPRVPVGRGLRTPPLPVEAVRRSG